MRWNKYILTTKSGCKHECILGEWLKPGKYDFGEVELVAEISGDDLKEYFIAEQAIYDIWYDEVLL